MSDWIPRLLHLVPCLSLFGCVCDAWYWLTTSKQIKMSRFNEHKSMHNNNKNKSNQLFVVEGDVGKLLAAFTIRLVSEALD